MKWSFPGPSVRRLAWIAAPLAAVALSGCTTRTTIRPDYLPRVIAAAARDPRQPVMVPDERGLPVQTSGRLDAVVVTLTSPRGWQQHFDAPVLARLDGPLLTVWDKRMVQSYLPPDVARITVQRYDTSRAIAVGTALTVTGALVTAFGIGLCTQIPDMHDGLPLFGIPILTAGIGLGVGGIPLIVAGKRAPATMITAGPGGLQLRF